MKYFDWNYDIKNDLNPLDINHYFFTSDICQSTNRNLNMYYNGACKTILSLECAIKKLITLY